jgi:RecA/RadA recombinase
MTDFFKSFIKELDNDDTMVASEGLSAAEFTGYIDTGSYIVNAAMSGTLFGGIPNNKAVVLAGDPGTGKTFFALGIIKNFLAADKKARIFYFDTESAVTNQMMESRGIDTKRVIKSEPESIERFRTVSMKLLDAYIALPQNERFPLLMVLDSLSMLPSKKEIQDITDEKDTRDMTKAQLIKGAFRVLRLKLAKANVGLIVTNHVYAVIGSYVPMKDMGGGSGAKYAADTIVFLSKKNEKIDDKVAGQIIHVKMVKSRLSREQTKIDTRILYDGGLDRYYGLLDLAEEAGLVKKVANKYEFPNGKKAFEKAIHEHPEQYFLNDFIQQLDEFAKRKFTYNAPIGGGTDDATTSESE